MQQPDPSTTVDSDRHVAPTGPAAPPEERHWASAFIPILSFVGWPAVIGLAYLRWNVSDNPFKGPFWNGGVDLAIVLWLGGTLFVTVAAIALGDFERLYRHLFRRPRC